MATSKAASFNAVRKIGRGMPGVEETTMSGSPALKLKGTLVACIATNKAAEPNTLVARIGFEQREDLLKQHPETYYLKPHYENYPVVLARLSKIRPDALRELLDAAWRFAAAKKPARKPALRKRAL
jgi:hypothetical protein